MTAAVPASPVSVASQGSGTHSLIRPRNIQQTTIRHSIVKQKQTVVLYINQLRHQKSSEVQLSVPVRDIATNPKSIIVNYPQCQDLHKMPISSATNIQQPIVVNKKPRFTFKPPGILSRAILGKTSNMSTESNLETESSTTINKIRDKDGKGDKKGQGEKVSNVSSHSAPIYSEDTDIENSSESSVIEYISNSSESTDYEKGGSTDDYESAESDLDTYYSARESVQDEQSENMNINQLYCREVKGKEEIVKLLANLDEANKKVMTSTLYKPHRSGIYVINRSKLKDYRDVTCDSLGSYVNSSSSGSTYDENFELVKEAQGHYILKTTHYTHKTYKCI